NPRLILGHNPDDDGPESDINPKPAIGDIVAIRAERVNGAPGICGDVAMSRFDFDQYLKSNSYPRRSAEIWDDDYLSEVALLGGQTPRRPVPDTRFSKRGARATFVRSLPVARFASPSGVSGDPGPGNVTIPDGDSTMPDDTTNGDLDQLKSKLKAMDEEEEKMKARLKAMEEENEELKAKLAEDEDDDEEAEATKAKAARLERERDQWKRTAEGQERRIAEIESSLLREKFTRKLEEARNDGYRVGDTEDFEALLTRIVGAKDPEAELAFFKRVAGRDPVNTAIDQSHARFVLPSTGPDTAKQEEAAKVARDRCVREGKRDMFKAYYAEALEKAAGAA
ncbi:MAG: hypothetical protein ACE5FA_11890, partial [Dehalococcoidia bacterium]